MNGLVIEASERDVKGTTRATLRAQQLVPAVVYGHGMEPITIAVSEKLFQGTTAIGKTLAKMKVGGKTMDVMVHAVQRDPVSRTVLHVDFYKVNLSEPIDVKIPLHVAGIEAVERKRGIVQQQTREVTIHVLPQNAPEVLTVDVSDLDVGDHFTVGDLSLPKGAELRSEPSEVIVSVLAAKRATVTDEETDNAEPTADTTGETA